MKTATVITLCCTQNKKVEDFQVNMLDSFIKNTPPECKLLVIENNSQNEQHAVWKDYVKSKGQEFVFIDEEFNMNKYYNDGTKMSNGEYVMYTNSDLLYHENWYENLISWYDKIDNLFSITPFSKALDWDDSYDVLYDRSVYRKNLEYKTEFYDTIHLGGWFCCFPRTANWIWDENFKAHYQDADFVKSLEREAIVNKKVCGVALNSRVDHLLGLTAKNTDGNNYYTMEGRIEMVKKWGAW
jgi:hypothetical protein